MQEQIDVIRELLDNKQFSKLKEFFFDTSLLNQFFKCFGQFLVR